MTAKVVEAELKVNRNNKQESGENNKMIKRNFINAAIVAAGMLVAAAANATVIDLSSGPPASGTINGALFFASDQQPTGTGIFDPFLRVQQQGNSTFEQGYNTDGGFPFDDKNPHNFQHSVELSSLAQFNINGTEYFKFTLDANQSGTTAHKFALDRLQFYTSNDPSQTTQVVNPDGTLNLGHLAYNLDAGGNNSVITTATGSGKADLVAYLPVSDFNLKDKYLILYFASGDTIAATGGFEEWNAASGASPVPEMSALFPIVGLLVAVGSTSILRRRRMARLNS